MKQMPKRLPDSELEIMMILWEGGGPMTSADILERLKDRKDWKPTSVLTFLSRLAEKEFVSVGREGRSNLYTPKVREEDYLRRESRSILQKLYGNSLTAFVSSLYDGRAVDEKELAELRGLLDELSGRMQP